VFSTGMDVTDVTLLPFVQRAITFIGEEVGETQDGIERRAQFVTHRGEELILEFTAAFHLLLREEDGMRKLFNLLLGGFQFRSASWTRCSSPSCASAKLARSLDLRQHFIKSIDQDSQFAATAGRSCTDGIILVAETTPATSARRTMGSATALRKMDETEALPSGTPTRQWRQCRHIV